MQYILKHWRFIKFIKEVSNFLKVHIVNKCSNNMNDHQFKKIIKRDYGIYWQPTKIKYTLYEVIFL